MLRTLLGIGTLIVTLVMFGLATSGTPSDPSLSDLGVSASAVRDANGGWRLQFELRYTGESPLAFPEASLPWRNPRDLLLVACAPGAAGACLKGADLPLREYSPTSLTLNPGDTLSGTVSVSEKFPALATARHSGDVILFWSYEIRTAGSQIAPRLHGSVVLPFQG
jgi:hypothetical protein